MRCFLDIISFIIFTLHYIRHYRLSNPHCDWPPRAPICQ